MALCYRTGVMGDQNLHRGNRHFRRFKLLWHWPNDLDIGTWLVLPADIRHVQIWTCYVNALQSYHLTHTHIHTETERIDRNYQLRRFAAGQWIASASLQLCCNVVCVSLIVILSQHFNSCSFRVMWLLYDYETRCSFVY